MPRKVMRCGLKTTGRLKPRSNRSLVLQYWSFAATWYFVNDREIRNRVSVVSRSSHHGNVICLSRLQQQQPGKHNYVFGD